MYDTIEDSLFCPFCGKKQPAQSFQTKSLACDLDVWSIEEILAYCENKDIINIYHNCDNCKKWIDINIEVIRYKDFFDNNKEKWKN